jgi:hypothetical protein
MAAWVSAMPHASDPAATRGTAAWMKQKLGECPSQAVQTTASGYRISGSLLDGYDDPDGVFGRPELNPGKEALRRLMVERGLCWTATNVRWRIAAWNILLV